MLTPGYARLLAHDFWPIGDTPAVCLTEALPPEKKADILLLGCGDVRNIFFTVDSDGKFSPTDVEDSALTCISDARQMDITCCDMECRHR
jgi:hypothetical protein